MANFFGFWHGEPLSLIHWMCLETFLSQGHNYTLYSYRKLEVPKGIELRDAADVIDNSDLFFFSDTHSGKDYVAPFADLFRYKLLRDSGGCWCDLDTICLDSNFQLADTVYSREQPETHPNLIGVGILALQARSELACALYEKSLDKITRGLTSYTSLGPDLFSRLIKEKNLPQDANASSSHLYPIKWIEAFKLWLPEFTELVRKRTRASPFISLYQSSYSHVSVPISTVPPDGSYLADYSASASFAGRQSPLDVAKIRAGSRTFFQRVQWATPALLNLVKVIEPDSYDFHEKWLRSEICP